MSHLMILVVRVDHIFYFVFTRLGVLVLALAALTACNTEANKKSYSDNFEINGSAQGTTYHIAYYSKERVFRKYEIDSILLQIDKVLSLWDSTSIISKVNNTESLRYEFRDPTHFFYDNFLISKEVFRATKGAFDPTVAPLVELWGFGLSKRAEVLPSDIDKNLRKVGFSDERITLTKAEGNYRILKSLPDIQLNFNGIAQGYSADVLSKYLAARGIKSHMVEIGGEVRVGDFKPGGKGWQIGIDRPVESDMRELQSIVQLTNQGLATSGNYRKFYVKDGMKYAHTIDPKNGYPVEHNLLSATVIADNSALADAYATAFMVLGYEKSLELLNSMKDVEAYFILSGEDGEFVTHATSGIAGQIQSLQ
jgi:thiamine biosynthesis lipoprotein